MKNPNIFNLTKEHLDWMTTLAFSSGVPESARREWNLKKDYILGIVLGYSRRQSAAAKKPRRKSEAREDIAYAIRIMAKRPREEVRNKELWDELFSGLNSSGGDYSVKEIRGNKSDPKTWLIIIQGEEKPYKFTTFKTQLSVARKKALKDPS